MGLGRIDATQIGLLGKGVFHSSMGIQDTRNGSHARIEGAKSMTYTTWVMRSVPRQVFGLD